MNKDILIISGHGIDLRVSGGGLSIKQGSALLGNSPPLFINRGLNNIEHLVILAQSGNLTIEAIKWLTTQNIAVSFLDEYGNLTTDFMPVNHVSGLTKRRQATAGFDINLKVSAWLLAEKFKGQRETLCYIYKLSKKANWWNDEREYRIEQALSISLDREQELTNCLNTESLRVLEAQTAAAYWQCFEGIPLNWLNIKKIPINWLGIGNRTSPKSGGPRRAIDPFNACLNYLYAVLETRIKRSCIINGVDPDFGIIHADRGNRASLVFDLMEPIRPKVDRLLFELVQQRKFNHKEFFETQEGICKVSKPLVTDIVPLIQILSKDIAGVVKEYAGFFKNRIIHQKPEEFKTNQDDNNKLSLTFKRKATDKQFVLDFTPTKADEPPHDGARHLKRNPLFSKAAKAKQDPDNKLRECPECGITFIANTHGQKFCCSKHQNAYQKRHKREQRLAEGCCPHCGKPMPEAAKGTYKDKLTYCPTCAEYFKKRYESKKTKSR